MPDPTKARIVIFSCAIRLRGIASNTGKHHTQRCARSLQVLVSATRGRSQSADSVRLSSSGASRNVLLGNEISLRIRCPSSSSRVVTDSCEFRCLMTVASAETISSPARWKRICTFGSDSVHWTVYWPAGTSVSLQANGYKRPAQALRFVAGQSFLIAAGGPEGKGRRAKSVNKPLETILTENHDGLVQPYINFAR